MKKILKSACIFSLVFTNSCEQNGMIVNCKKCKKEEPKNIDIEIKIDIIDFRSAVVICIYEGNIEDGVLRDKINTVSDKVLYKATPNKKYTFSALYSTSDGTYTTVDSAMPGIVFNRDQCDYPCYYVYDKVVNLKLKYN